MSTPESPPAGPIIPVGFGTRLGVWTASLATLFALVAAVLRGDHTPETITGLAVAALAVVRTIDGRMSQAAAAIAGPPIITVPEVEPRPWTYTAQVGAGDVLPTAGAFVPSIEDPALDDPEHDEDEPELTDVDLSGRMDGTCKLEDHRDLAGDDDLGASA